MARGDALQRPPRRPEFAYRYLADEAAMPAKQACDRTM